jgi:hypothetical protein
MHAKALIPGERLTGQLEQHTFEDWFGQRRLRLEELDSV